MVHATHSTMDVRSNDLRYSMGHLSILLILLAVMFEAGVVATAVLGKVTYTHLVLTAVTFFFMALTYSLRVSVDRDTLYVSYGVGLFVTEVDLASIESMTIEPNNHLISWLYNPFGEHVIRAKIRGGGTITIPAHEAKALHNLLKIRI